MTNGRKSRLSFQTDLAETKALLQSNDHSTSRGSRMHSDSGESNQSDRDISSGSVNNNKNTDDESDGEYIALPPHRGAEIVRRIELLLLWIGSLGPAMVISNLVGRPPSGWSFVSTAVALVISATVAWYILSRVLDHANARRISYVLPINTAVLLTALAVIALSRIPYSVVVFATGAMATVTVSYLLTVYSLRLTKPHVVVPGGRSSEVILGGQFLPAPSVADLDRLIDSGRRDWVIVADLHYPHSESGERLFAKAALQGIPVYHFRQIAEMQSGQVKISHLSENDLGSLNPDASYASIKRFVDIILVLVLTPIVLPFLILIAALIRIDSVGSPIFIQERMGFRGQTFKMIKFRTMHKRTAPSDKDQCRDDAMTKSDDQRITRVGRFLRKTRIDEIPQMFNVLCGEMSFIGPRPEACSLSEWYESEIPFYCYRHIVRPGITGWAQVNQGHVTDVGDVLAKLRYDFYYIKNISLWLDILIVLKTIRVIINGVGAK